MPIDYAALVAGQLVSNKTILLDEEKVLQYVHAVSDSSALQNDGNKIVPAMAVAALSLGGVINDLQIPGGTLHSGQELEFLGAVAVGETLDCKATLAQNSTRGKWRFLVVQLNDGGD